MVKLLQKLASIIFTEPSSSMMIPTNTVIYCAGSTNSITTKTMLGNGSPSGVTSFSLSPSTLGQFTMTNVNLSGSGEASMKFLATTNAGVKGLLIATSSNLVDQESGIKLPPNFSVSTNLTVIIPKVSLTTATNRLRDEIFSIQLQMTPALPITVTNVLSLSKGTRRMNFGTRQNVQVYDFGVLTGAGGKTASPKQLTATKFPKIDG